MKSKNKYEYPIDKDSIQRIIAGKSSTHRIYTFEDSVLDLTNAVDFLCKEGTSIKAALDGEVVAVVDNIQKNTKELDFKVSSSALKEKTNGNFVLIKHNHREFS